MMINRGLLGVHVSGSGFGESIVLTCPNGSIGVIDSYGLGWSKQPRSRQALSLLDDLKETFNASSLRFIAVTHPHEDHVRGLSLILEGFCGAIGEIWIYNGYHQTFSSKHLESILKRKVCTELEQAYKEAPGTVARELIRIRNLVFDQCHGKRQAKPILRLFCGYQSFMIEGEPVKIHFLGPSQGISDGYIAKLSNNHTQMLEAAVLSGEPFDPMQLNHNVASPAILVEYGKSRLLLGGDMEAEAWEQVLEESDSLGGERPRLHCDFVKVSHHGSANGYVPGLYERFSRDGKRPLAVVTPFTRNTKPLPSEDGIRHISSHVSELIATNRAEAERSANLGDLSQGIPARWISDIAAEPELRAVLHPRLTASRADPGTGTIPMAWIADLASNPSLRAFIHPTLWGPSPSVRSKHSAYRVSCYFDAEGRERRSLRRTGEYAGPIEPVECGAGHVSSRHI